MSRRPPPPDKLLRYPEAAAFLGITVDALYMRVYRGQIAPSYRSGRSVWFTREDICKALTATKQPSPEASDGQG